MSTEQLSQWYLRNMSGAHCSVAARRNVDASFNRGVCCLCVAWMRLPAVGQMRVSASLSEGCSYVIFERRALLAIFAPYPRDSIQSPEVNTFSSVDYHRFLVQTQYGR
jgi:hypothetical protein